MKLLPDSSMSLIRVSMGVFPTRRTKKSCSMTEEETVRREGKRSSSFPNLLGWLGYWLLTYSSKAHWDFSCRPSTWATSDRPQASTDREDDSQTENRQGKKWSRPVVHPAVWYIVLRCKRFTSYISQSDNGIQQYFSFI